MLAGCGPRFPLLPARVSVESSAYLTSWKDGSRLELLVPFRHPKVLYSVSFLLWFCRNPWSSACFGFQLSSGQTHTLDAHVWLCPVSGAPGGPIQGRSHTADFLLIVAQSLGLPGGLIFSAADLTCRVGLEVMLFRGVQLLPWPGVLAARL